MTEDFAGAVAAGLRGSVMSTLPTWLTHPEPGPQQPAAPKAGKLAWAAREHHAEWLARTADAATFERDYPDGARVRGDVVEVLSGGKRVARYRWSWRFAGGRYVLRFRRA